MVNARERPLRVLTLVAGTHGGAESLARQIALRLDRSRFESVFCITRSVPRSDLDLVTTEMDAAGVAWIDLGRKTRLDLRPWYRLAMRLRRQRFDVIHAHMLGSNVWGAVLSSLARVPVFVAHEHTWSFEGEPLRRFLDRELIARRADAFVAVSEADRRRMHEIERIPWEKLRFVPNGIAARGEGRRAGPEVRAELGIAPEQPVLGIVATLRPQKALDVLLRAVVPLAREFPALRVLVVGGETAATPQASEPRREQLEELAEQLGIAATVRFLGPRLDVPELLQAFDVAALSSDFEGSPLGVMEYMEAGLPVVATRVGGMADLIEDGRQGLLVPPRDPEALAAAVATLLRDPERAREMGRAGRERRRREFSIEGTVRRIEDLYEELYAEKVGARR